jgi:hypothetical protein
VKRFLFFLICTTAVLCLLATPALARPKTVIVAPAGKWNDMHSTTTNDTANIQAAFAAAGPGGTVQLTAGRFYANTIVVRNFNGCFKGAGEGQTSIDCLRGLNPSLPGVTVTPDVEPYAFLIGFCSGNVSVSAMSFDITAHDPAEPFYTSQRTDLGDVVLVTGNASSSFDQVGFSCGKGDKVVGANVAADIGIVGKLQVDGDGNWTSLAPTGGVHRVTRCSFTAPGGLEVIGFRAGSVIVGGSAAMRNVFNIPYDDGTGVAFVDVSDSCIAISHNQITTVGSGGLGVFTMQGSLALQAGGALPPLPAPRYVITDNDISASGAHGAGVGLVDLSYSLYGAASRTDAVIADNTIVLGPEGGSRVGIIEYGTKNIKVLGNCLSGSALAGIYVGDSFAFGGGGPSPVSGWQIIGNDLGGLTASLAPIVLGEGSTHCYVACPTMTAVLDKGVDNILVNAYRLPWSP